MLRDQQFPARLVERPLRNWALAEDDQGRMARKLLRISRDHRETPDSRLLKAALEFALLRAMNEGKRVPPGNDVIATLGLPADFAARVLALPEKETRCPH